jgi:hypothetical protein
MIHVVSKASTGSIAACPARNRPGFSLDSFARLGDPSSVSQQSRLAQRRATAERPHRNDGDFQQKRTVEEKEEANPSLNRLNESHVAPHPLTEKTHIHTHLWRFLSFRGSCRARDETGNPWVSSGRRWRAGQRTRGSATKILLAVSLVSLIRLFAVVATFPAES